MKTIGKAFIFAKTWALPISMIIGALSYLIYSSIHALDFTHAAVGTFVSYIQPTLLFIMLFISFCKVDFRQLKPRSWMLKPLLVQVVAFTAMGVLIAVLPNIPGRVIIESAMLCMICPTATAAAVVTSRLEGNASAVISYTCLINMAASLVIPIIVPMMQETGMDFGTSFLLIIGQVFPLLIMPLMAAWLVGHIAPEIHKAVRRNASVAFYIWTVSLSLAIAVSVKAIAHSDESVLSLAGIAIASLVCCLLQFAYGRHVGNKHGETIAGTQMMGQKATVFIIWAGYTFMTPVTAISGGFYSVWHNAFNSWQLYKKGKEKARTEKKAHTL